LVQRDRGEVPAFQRVLIETSGIADPAPVAQLFLNTPLLSPYLRLDAIVVTIDAVNGATALDRHWEAQKQIVIADRLLITKTDIASEHSADALTASLRRLNSTAPIHRVLNGNVDPALLFGVGPFDPTGRAPAVAEWLGEAAHSDADHGHQHEVQSLCLTAEIPLDWARFHDWLSQLRAAHGDRLLRVKGVLNVAGEDGPIAIHGVQHVFHPPVALPRWPDQDRRSRLVLIAGGLDRHLIGETWELVASLPSNRKGRMG
jgi:G3E family GTPase